MHQLPAAAVPPQQLSPLLLATVDVRVGVPAVTTAGPGTHQMTILANGRAGDGEKDTNKMSYDSI